MFRREWLQSSRISVLELAYISVGKELHPAQSMEEPEFWRHRTLKDAIADGALTSCGERYLYPRMPDVPHGGSLLRFDDLADYAKTVSFGWLDDLLRLWAAVRAGAPQDEMEEIFTSLRLDVEGLASDWRSLQSLDNETTLIAVPEGAPDSDTAQSDAIDVDTSGSDQTDAEIDVTQGDTREAEHDALDDAGDGIDRSRIRPTEFTPEEQSKGGNKPKIHFGLLEYLERLCDSGLAADFRKRSDITLGEIEQILTAFAKGGPVEDRIDIIINDFEHARYDEIAKTLYWEDWMQEQNDKPRKRQQALKSLQPYLDIINGKKPRPEKQDTLPT